MKKNFFQTSLRLAAAPAVLGLALLSTQAQAADEADDAAGEEAIIVTGTLIRNPNLISSNPVSVIGAEEASLRQSNVAEELLRTLPGAVPSIGSAVNNGNGGSSYVDLRGIGSFRNVVLLDGVRVVPADLAGRFDLNNVPLALIERVESLTGGASSTYGADAVGGVVNFITKSNFTGMELNVSDQFTGHDDGNFFRADLTLGASFDGGRGNAVLSIGYQKSQPVYFGGVARPLSQLTLESYDEFFVAGQGSSTTSPSALDIGGGRPRQQITADGTGISNFYKAYNFNPLNVFQVPFKRYNIYSAAHYDVTDAITVYARGLFSNNTVDTIIAPSGVFASSVTVPVSNPFISSAQRTYLCANADSNPSIAGNQTLTTAECGAAATALSPSDPAYRTFTFGLRRRMPEVGLRVSDYNTQVFDLQGGVRGKITDNISFDVYGTYGRSDKLQTIQGYVLLSRVRNALLATSTTSCLSGGDCVPLNIFGADGSITPEMADYVSDDSSTRVTTEFSQVHGTISGDFGVTIPWAAEPISFAVGAETRRYKAQQRSDVLAKTAGELGGAGGAAPDITGSLRTYEGFAEVVVPVVADMPLAKEVTLEAGIRQSHYDIDAPGNPQFDTTTWKVAGSWAPNSDIRFRANYQHAVRAPNISELFSPVTTGLTNLGTDPCAGANPVNNANLRAVCLAQGAPAATIGFINQPTAGQANVTSGGNPFVKPEKADTWTLGAVFTPTFLPGFTATVDYYNIKVNEAISTPTPGDSIAACFGANPTAPDASAATSAACTIIRRNPITGALDGDPATTPGLFGALSNLGTIETNGLDFGFGYTRPIGTAFGETLRLSLSFNGNYTLSSKFQATPSALNRECVNQYSVNCASIQPTFQFNERTTLSAGPFDLSLLWRYINPVHFEDQQQADDLAAAVAAGCTDPEGADPDGCIVDPRFRKIRAYHYFDLTARWEVTQFLSVTFTMQNMFDVSPPTVGGTVGSTTYNGGNTYPSTYDTLGRRFAFGARLKF